MFGRLFRRRRRGLFEATICWNDDGTSNVIDRHEPDAEARVKRFAHCVKVVGRMEDGEPKLYARPESDSPEDYWNAVALVREALDGLRIKICIGEPPSVEPAA